MRLSGDFSWYVWLRQQKVCWCIDNPGKSSYTPCMTLEYQSKRRQYNQLMDKADRLEAAQGLSVLPAVVGVLGAGADGLTRLVDTQFPSTLSADGLHNQTHLLNGKLLSDIPATQDTFLFWSGVVGLLGIAGVVGFGLAERRTYKK